MKAMYFRFVNGRLFVNTENYEPLGFGVKE